jgi:DNA-binding transcriptional ArsR family regulator
MESCYAIGYNGGIGRVAGGGVQTFFRPQTFDFCGFGRVMKNDPIQPSRCARQLSALASPERLKIIRFLRGGPANVTEIAEMLRTPLVNVTHHMGVLRQAGLVRNRKQGRFVYYSLAPGLLQTEEGGVKEFLDLGCCRLEVPGGDATDPA